MTNTTAAMASTTPFSLFNATFFDNDTLLNYTALEPPTAYHHNKIEVGLILQIGLCSVIFLLAVLGNVLVILTLVQNQGMRTITNLFLLNLAVSDLLIGVVCIPFTLVAQVLKNFVFGPVLCKVIPFLQAVSVSVSAWTLVAISVERYYAICHPLTSRRWQTLSHAYKIIAIVWLLSLSCMSPIAGYSVLLPQKRPGRYKCREYWPSPLLEKGYTLFLDIILLVLPLVIMSVKYSLITRTLWQASSEEASHEQSSMLATSQIEDTAVISSQTSSNPNILLSLPNSSRNKVNSSFKLKSCHSAKRGYQHRVSSRFRRKDKDDSRQNGSDGPSSASRSPSLPPSSAGLHGTSSSGNFGSATVNGGGGSSQPTKVLRRSNVAMSLKRKKRVIQMLGVVVAEFFICWTPIYVMNTWYLFDPYQVYDLIGDIGVSLIQILAYTSSCSNPITYCFMNRGFRMSFFHVFGCHCSTHRQPAGGRNDSFRLTRTRSTAYSGYYSTNNHIARSFRKNNNTVSNLS